MVASGAAVTPAVYEAVCLSCLLLGHICLHWTLQSFEKYAS